MYLTIQEFIDDWKNESTATMKILRTLTDESLSQKVYDGGRTLGRIAWHIVYTIGEMTSKTGLGTDVIDENAEPPASAESIAIEYKKASDQMVEEVEKQWTDDMLAEKIELYGQKWSRAATLSVLVRHEIHHRAQMTVLMRQAGLPVPGIYGPSKEEWSKFGMDPQK